MPKNRTLLVTCEHGGNRVPPSCRPLFEGQKRVLDSHRGYDKGALDLARILARTFRAPLHHGNVSRLVVDLNRSPDNPRRFSTFTRGLPCEAKNELMERIHRPYWEAAHTSIHDLLKNGSTVIHVSVHSFTPVLRDTVRRAQIGLLYDPARTREAEFCRKWQKGLQEAYPSWVIRRNYPYKGTSDSLAVSLRHTFPTNRFLSIELEVNQRVIEKVIQDVDAGSGPVIPLQEVLISHRPARRRALQGDSPE